MEMLESQTLGNNHTSPSETLPTIHPMSDSLQCVANMSHKIHEEKHVCLQICLLKNSWQTTTNINIFHSMFSQQSFRYVFPIWTQLFKFDTRKRLNSIDSFRHVTFSPFQHLNTCFITSNIYSHFGLSWAIYARFRVNMKHIGTTKWTYLSLSFNPWSLGQQQ